MASVAQAGHYIQPGADGGHPNDTAHVFWWTSTLYEPWITHVNWNRTNNIDPRIFNTGWTPSHDLSDVTVWNQDLGQVLGRATCGEYNVNDYKSPADSNMCLHYHVVLNHVYPLTYTEQRMNTCHELGHTLDLAHRSTSEVDTCMRQGILPYTYFDGHDRFEIDRHNPPGWCCNDVPTAHVH